MALALDNTAPLNDDRPAPGNGTPRALQASAPLRVKGAAARTATDALAARLPRLTQAAAQASRVLFDARLDALVARLAGVDAWQLRPASDTADVARVDEPGRIVLVHVAGSLSIDVDLRRYPALQILAGAAGSNAANVASVVNAMSAANAANAANTGASHALRQSIATALLAPLTETLLEAGAGTWRVADVQRLSPHGSAAMRRPSSGGTSEADALDATGDTLAARVDVMFQGERHDALIHASPAILAMLERRIAAPHASPFASAAASVLAQEHPSPFGAALAPACHPAWRVPGRIALGARRIGIAALEALRPGDVLLRTMPPHTETALRLGNPFRARAAWGSAGLTRFSVGVEIDDCRLAIIEEPIMTDEPQQPDEGMPPLAVDFQGEPIEIGDLDLPVQFELDSVALPLAQLTSLRPGYVIELDTPVVDAQIRLVAHGQTIGYGELIAVAEHLGIRIVRMAHGDGSVR
nr:Yop proteins translocation protein Q [Paraburkholderia busanensis]